MISGKTDCGLKYAVKRSGSAVAYCSLSIKCGTRDESGYPGGIAHFAEHTIFKGTEKRSATVINGYLDRLGGELNAFTTKEEIVFHATVLKEDFPKAASLLFELATTPTFPENEIETEKGVVIDEIHSYKDSLGEDIYDKFEEMLFKGHPLSANILGTARSVKKIKSNDLKDFVKERFVPEKMAFSVVADLDEGKMERVVRKLSEKFFHTDIATTKDSEDNTLVPFSSEVRFDKTINKRSHQANCIIGGLAPSLYQEDERIATVLLCNILGGPATNSILNYSLREKKGWVYSVECSYTQYADTGIVAISFGCDKHNVEKCRGEIEKILKKLQEAPFPQTRLKAAKKQLLGQMAIGSDNGETQCLSMGKSLLAYGKITTGTQTKEMIDRVTSEDIMNAARKVLDLDKLSRLTYI